jgi:hypothetical protein
MVSGANFLRDRGLSAGTGIASARLLRAVVS